MTDRVIDRARDQRNLLERIRNFIPGYHGYYEKEVRRDADKVEREYIAEKLDQNKDILKDVVLTVTDSGGVAALKGLDRIEKKLEKLYNRIKYADRGYAGLFDMLKVKQPELDRLYEFDLALLESVKAIEGMFSELSAAKSDVSAVKGKAEAITAALEALDTRFSERENILIGKA